MQKEYNRKLNRLKGYDYSQDGYYFVTICTKNRIEIFGQVNNGEMILNGNGNIVYRHWLDLPNHFWNCQLDEFVVMPNHLHGIVIINNQVGTDLKSVSTERDLKRYSLSNIIQGFKIFSSRCINKQNRNIIFRWQRSFYDHIIRNDISLYKIRQYIIENPLKWELDRNNPKNLYL